MNEIINILSHKSGAPMKKGGVPGLSFWAKRIGLALVSVLILSWGQGLGQAVGDYGTTGAGPNRWDQNASWCVCVTAGTWTGATAAAAIPAAGTNVWIRAGHSIQVRTSNGANVCNNMDVAGSVVYRLNNTYTLTVNGNVTGSGSIDMSAGTGTSTLIIGGNYTNTGTFTCSNGLVNYNRAGAQTIAALNYYNLTISGARTTNNVTLANAGTIGIAGTFTNSATFTSGGYVTTGSTVNYNGTGAQTIVGINYNNLTISGAHTTNNVTLDNTNTIGLTGSFNNSATFTSGGFVNTGSTVNYNGTGAQFIEGFNYNNLTISGVHTTNNITLDNVTDIGIAGTFTNSATFTSGGFINTNSTIDYNGAGAQNIIAFAYNNLNTSNGGTKTSSGSYTLNGNLTVGIGTTLSLGTGAATWNISGSATIDGTLDFGTIVAKTVNLTGDLINVSGTITMTGALAHNLNLGGLNNAISTFNTTAASGSTVNYNRTGVQQIFGSANYQNLTLNGGSAKTLQAVTTVNGTLTLTSGILQLGNNNLTLANTTAIAGAFSNTSMIETNGTGFLIRSANATNALFNGTYPVGNGSYYEPVIISGLAGAVAAARSVYVRSVPSNPAIFGNGINKYWDLTGTTVTAGAGATLSLQYNATDATGNQTILQPYTNTSGSWQLATGASAGGVNPMTSTGNASFAGLWSAGSSTTYYSYQSGDWSTALTWTTDPSGTLSVNPGVPGSLDNVVILNGRTVSITSNTKTVTSLEIRLGGYLDLTTTTGHNFGTVTGQGVLKLSSSNFPAGTYTSFVAAGGGTVEYNNSSNFTLSSAQTIYNNLIINLNTSAIIGNVLMSNLTINGTFTVQNGTFMIGQDAAYAGDGRVIIDFKQDVVVTNNGNIIVGLASTNNNNLPAGFTGKPYSTGMPPSGYEAGALVPRYYDIYHKVYIGGNLINNGSVKFISSAVTIPNYTNLTASGAATVRFYGLNNANLTCNGQTDFYNLILDKGSDQTYILTVDAAATSNFRLFGRNDWGGGGGADANNPELDKALWIRNGTLRLTGYVTIPSFSEGSCAGGSPNSDFYIPLNGALLIDGPNVTVLSTADSYQEVNAAYGLNQVSNTYNINTGAGCSSFSIYGKFQMNSGFMSTRESGGFIFWSNANGVFIFNGGYIDAKQLRSAGGVSGVASFIQNGGTLQLRGRYTINGAGITNTVTQIRNAPVNYGSVSTGGLGGGFGTFNINNANNLFTMTGNGIMNILDVCQDNGYAFEVRSNAQNNTVTGGTVNINTYNNTNYYIYTTSPIQNLNLTRLNGTATVLQSTALVINNALSLTANSILNTQNFDLTVGGNLTLNTGCTYTPGTNSTILNGNGGQVFTNAGTITSGLNNFVLSNASNTNITNNLTVLGNLTISNNACYLNDQGNSINVAGNIVNSGIHTSQANGAIILNGAGAQTIGGNGSGVFGNLAVNKAAGTCSFTADQTVTGNIRLASGILDINRYKLTLSSTSNVYDALAGVTTVFGNTKMITLTGMVSDGGITKPYIAVGSFIFPIGNAGGYRPATIGFTIAPTTWGSVNIKLGARVHPLATSANALKYYWKVVSTGFTGIQPNSVSHAYHFINPGDINAGTLANYIPGVYNPYAWTVINDVSQVNKINYNVLFTNVGYLDGEYTAGQPDAFNTVNILYSRKVTGNWEDADMWSNDPVLKWGGAACGCFPGTDDIVLIGDGSTYNHTVTVTASNKTVGSLTINTGSVLDLVTTTGHNFGVSPDQKITGSGKLRISSTVSPATFPGGDFGNFLNTGGGTVEYYSLAASPASITLPVTYNVGATSVNITNYNNLNLSPISAKNIILPNTDLTIFGNLTANGSGTGLAEFNNQNSTHTITVNGNVNVSSGTLEYFNTNAAAVNNMVVTGDISVTSGATFDVAATNTATSNLSIQGNLINNGTFNMRVGTPCNVTFTGSQNKGISGAGATTNFNILTVNKGIDRNSILEVTSTAFSLNAALATALTLTNGTFRLTSPLAITLTTTNAFTVPISGCLSANGGTINIGQANNNAGDLMLQGRLEVLAGAVNIGNGGGSNNDIEYASAGNPEIIVSGGTLRVDGQIRRNTSNTLGSLWYTQSGGTVTVRGLGFNNTRGMFEVTNTGSQFNMSGGTLNIERSCGGVATYADVYIVPATNSVTGGTLQFGNTNTPAGQTFALNSSSPLGSVLVDGTTTNIVSLEVNPLILVNDLTINGAASNFNCNGLNITIGRNLTNSNTVNTVGTANGGYQPGSSTQITTFNGSSPAIIAGVAGNLTNFANLVVGSSSTVTMNPSSNLAVNTNLTLNSGTLADGGNTITVYGNITNNATHTSSAGNGIVLGGSAEQVISGSGSGVFGNVNISNTNGVNMVDNSTINGTLTLSNGVFYIDDYKLTLGTSATVTTGSTFGLTRMIAMNGVISDQGVVKNTSGTLTNYLLPIGITGKYTPATFTVSSPASGSIKVLPVNRDHPADNDANGNELAYYWKVVTTGFAGLTSATQVFNYLAADVSGNESLYRGARYYNAAFTDLGGVPGVINTTNHTITVTGSFVDGEYTAGEAANFTNKHILYSKASGNWTDNIWAEDLPSNPLCGYYPNGNPIYIQPGHTVTMNIDNSFAYSVDISTTGVLDLVDKLYSDLGFITGTGKMRLKGTTGGSYIFPGGNYDAFMADPTGQSTVEFYGTNTATLPLKPGNVYKPYQNVIFTDAGTKYMSAEHMKVLKNLTINNGASLNNTLQNKNLYILGNWTDNNVTTSGFVPGSGLVSFEGTIAQQLTVVNNLTENFYDFRVSNPLGVSLTVGGGLGDVLVSDNLYLTNGVTTTSATNTLTLSNTSPSAAIGGSTSSYVDGPLNKAISSGSYFNFPVGNSSRYGNVYVSNASAAGTWTGQYFNAAPTYNVNSKLSPIDQVSNNEYWWVSGPATAQGNVQLRWDANSGFSSSTAASRSKIRAIEWNPTLSQWEYRGKILNDGGPNSGTVQTDNIISLATGVNLHYLTIGMESLPTATITSSLTPNVCNDGVNSTTVTVALTGTAPWSLSYKLGTVTTTLTNIASSPASIVLTSASPGVTGVGPFNFNITNVNDAVGIPGVKDYTTTAVLTVKPVPTPAIAGRTTVGTSEAGVAYSTTSVGGDTYTWTVTGGSIASGQNTAAITVNWGAAAGTGTVSVTETNGAPNNCSITKSINVTIVSAPTPNVTGSANVCANETGDVYYTPNIATHSYVWTVSGGTFTGPTVVGGNNQIVVNWGIAGPGSVKVDETFGSTVSNTLTVTINPLPSTTIPTVANVAMCTGGSTTLTVTNAEAATDYNLYSGAPLITTVHASTAGNYNFPAITPASTTNYTVQAVSQYGCVATLSSTPSITVNTRPTVTFTAQPGASACASTNVVYTTQAGQSSYVWVVPGVLNTDYTISSGGLSATDNTVTLKWLTTGSKTVTINYNNVSGCAATTATSSTATTVTPLPATGPVYRKPNN